MKYLRKTELLLTIGIVLMILTFAGCAFLNAEDPLEKLKSKTETAALNLSRTILKSQLVEPTQISEYLTEQGWSVIISQDGSPSYLSNPQPAYSFWNDITIGKNSELQYVSIHKSGGLSLTVLHYEDGAGTYLSMNAEWGNSNLPVISSWEAHTIQDWDLSEHGNFYFRIRPAGDKHYIDYCLLRLIPPDSEMTSLTNHYITPIGYYSVNMFLCDWDGQNLGTMAPNDLLEYIYRLECHCDFSYESYPHIQAKSTFLIPASEFEGLLLSYLDIPLEDFRVQCNYDAEENAYPWTPFFTEDADRYWFPHLDAEVIRETQNSDGTITLTVNVGSPDLKADTVFIHEVTIRQMGENAFQYVSNRIVSQTEYGMPNNVPRLSYRDQ